ncbi:ribosomal protein S18 acetylase RimI-like enzyme [Paenibacillus turicensis]|uniref:Ribosomal protein S18 acetylase RimI-like enzyme n=1 Tax=Paenibacillus turicensis TaxID=160487 RepID=A0ABS4FS28_9BACL|nr:GNAT family N-acetyltransferase [Paenibacillus turicensis]MBP1905379.1 ribosomal protein S18 acetylase RimI-like enzyme [Paenibacillus turicensis]
MKATYSLEQATIHDVPQLAVLFDQYRVFYGQPSNVEGAKQFLLDRFNHAESVILVAKENENEDANTDANINVSMNANIVGFTQLYPTFSSISMQRSWILNDLYVAEEHRKQGIAEQLLEQAKRFAMMTNAKGIALSTAPTNKQAQALYEKLGYVRDDEFYNYFLSV